MTSAAAESDLSALPSVTFGPRSLMWWGTVGFMVIEGWTTAILVVSFLYLRQNYETWPPLRTPNPSLLIPTINLILMILAMIPARSAERAARRLDTRSVKLWLTIFAVAPIPILTLRWWELQALNTRWDTSAYGTGAWTIVGFHTSLLLLDALDTIGLLILFLSKELPVKAFSDTADNSFYAYFTVALWIPIYLIVYVGPRFL